MVTEDELQAADCHLIGLLKQKNPKQIASKHNIKSEREKENKSLFQDIYIISYPYINTYFGCQHYP